MSTPVIIAVRGEREALVASHIDAHPDLIVARRCADLSEALAASHAGVGAVVVLSEQPQLDRAVVAEFLATGVAVVGAPLEAEGQRFLEALGVSHVLAPHTDASHVATLIADAVADAPEIEDVLPPSFAHGRGPSGAIIAVWGPTGAPGRTMMATNIAAEAADITGNSLVIDVDTYGGAVSQALGLLDEAPGIAALARGSLNGTLTDELVARHALTVAAGFRVLSGMTRADRWPELSPAALEPVWETVRRHAAITVVDCGFSLESDEELAYDTRAPQRNGATLSALAAADAVVVVGSSEPLAMQRLVQAIGDLKSVDRAVGSIDVVVVNRLRADVAGARPREAVADALQRYAGVEQTWTIPYDAKACDAATLAGQVLKERVPRSAPRKAIQELTRHLVSVTARPPQHDTANL